MSEQPCQISITPILTPDRRIFIALNSELEYYEIALALKTLKQKREAAKNWKRQQLKDPSKSKSRSIRSLDIQLLPLSQAQFSN